jgi:glycine oxidase
VVLVALTLRGPVSSVGPLLGELRADAGLPSVAAAMLTSLPLVCFGLVSPFAPLLARRLGLHRAVLAGAVVLACGLGLRAAGLPGLFAGTVLVGCDAADLQVVRRTSQLLRAQRIVFEDLDRRDLRRREPTLSARVAGGVLLPDDRSVNPRDVAAALIQIVGDRLVRKAATPTDQGVLLEDETTVCADVVVIATGAASGVQHVRPVKGEIIRARVADLPAYVVRARVHGQQVYVVPRAGNQVVIGATEEEHPGEPYPTTGGITRLLTAARVLLPGLETAEILELTARHRPGTPDNGPLLGPVSTAAGRRILATGHYRGGVLLAPLTAATVRAYIENDDVPVEARAFHPDRLQNRPQNLIGATR